MYNLYYDLQMFIIDYVCTFKHTEQSLMFIPTYIADMKIFSYCFISTIILVYLQNKLNDFKKLINDL